MFTFVWGVPHIESPVNSLRVDFLLEELQGSGLPWGPGPRPEPDLLPEELQESGLPGDLQT